MVCVDIFEGELAGLIAAEAEFETVEAMEAFPIPDFAMREVTDDICYIGGHLA
jgi:CYTH domain-containing protein